MHAQLLPVYFREPSVNLGVGEARGLPPHLTGTEFLTRFGIPEKIGAGLCADRRRTSRRWRKSYGRIGGLDRLATVVKRVRAERGRQACCCSTAATPGRARWARTAARARTWSTAWLLKPDAMTGHWEFTYGEARVKELIDALGFPFLALNVRDTEWNEAVFAAYQHVREGRREDRGARPGLSLYAGRQSALDDPEMDVRHPRGRCARQRREGARREGAQLVVLLSHNGFDVDRKLASRVAGIDVILTGHTHDALPEAVQRRQDVADRLRQPRQVPLAPRSRCARRRR